MNRSITEIFEASSKQLTDVLYRLSKQEAWPRVFKPVLVFQTLV